MLTGDWLTCEDKDKLSSSIAEEERLGWSSVGVVAKGACISGTEKTVWEGVEVEVESDALQDCIIEEKFDPAI